MEEVTKQYEYPPAYPEDDEIEALEAVLDTQSNDSEIVATLQDELDAVNAQLRDLEQIKGRASQRDTIQVRIKELEAREQELIQEYEETERQLQLLEEFIKTEIDLQEERVNQHFAMARFKMFEEQINGGIKDTCVTTYKGTPYPSLSNSERVNVGIDIINALSALYEVYLPIIVDNAESINKVLDSESQRILLKVTNGKKLTIQRS
jgi:hypothetical protein